MVTRSFASDKRKSFAKIFTSRTKLNFHVLVIRKMVKKVRNILISSEVPCPYYIPSIELTSK